MKNNLGNTMPTVPEIEPDKSYLNAVKKPSKTPGSFLNLQKLLKKGKKLYE